VGNGKCESTDGDESKEKKNSQNENGSSSTGNNVLKGSKNEHPIIKQEKSYSLMSGHSSTSTFVGTTSGSATVSW